MIWSFTLAGLGMVSLVLTGRKLKSGWLVGLFNSGLWIIYALTTQQFGFLISSAFYIAIQTKNFLDWSKADRIKSGR
jgi:nicotinamide riboside transporter PnuC